MLSCFQFFVVVFFATSSTNINSSNNKSIKWTQEKKPNCVSLEHLLFVFVKLIFYYTGGLLPTFGTFFIFALCVGLLFSSFFMDLNLKSEIKTIILFD